MFKPFGSTQALAHCPLPSQIGCSTLSISLHQLAESLGMAVDAKDPCTCEHSEEVAVISQILALRMGYSPREAEAIHIAGHLHDIGKIGIPDTILFKPGPLTPREWAVVKRHPVIGEQIVRPVKVLGQPGGIADVILHHHENYDGTGYPSGLRGRDIPRGARIIAVADSLSAMLQPRTYKPAMDFKTAAADIVRYSGQRYDPRVVQAFTQCHSEINTWLSGMHRPDLRA
ncbi:MAG: HD-GYP domain-containing protein [Proteobacteria bacterium]|nr:HD-GYP domain-containing protein [Pseudomonadota bacterium]